MLGIETRQLHLAKTPPRATMPVGLHGAGNATHAVKLSPHANHEGDAPLTVSAHLQRANAVNPLQVNGERAGVPVFAPHPCVSSEHEAPTGDPVEAAKAGLEEAKTRQHDIVIIDTAGRLGVDQELMQQAADIRAATNPDEVLFVIDAMI